MFNPAPLAVAVARRWLADGTGERLVGWQRAEMAARFALAGHAGVQIGPTSYFWADARPTDDGFRLCLGNAPDRPSLADGLARLVAVLDGGPTWASGTRV